MALQSSLSSLPSLLYGSKYYSASSSFLLPPCYRVSLSPNACHSGIGTFQIVCSSAIYHFSRKVPSSSKESTRNRLYKCLQCTSPSSSGSSPEDSNSTSNPDKAQFGYTRKDVLLIGLGVTVLGIGLKSGLEFVGVDPLQAGNVVQLVLVLGLTIGWISTYIFRVSNKEMTYAQQLRDYEKKVMEKRLEGLTEAELEALLEQIEEEKRRLASSEQP